MTTRSQQPPPPLPTHRRHRGASSSFSSISTTSSSSAASSSSPPSSPPAMAASVVPFSWEDHPGIPKIHHGTFVPSPLPLPLPPPPPSSARHRRRRTRNNAPPADGGDPFAAALEECTREERAAGIDMDALFPPTPAKAKAMRRRTAGAAGGGLLGLYGCKSAMAVAEGAFVVVRRPAGRPGRR
ncbi:potassium voltage-gated channel subfamily C member 3 [Brachypodium distachyon]|uniref:Uncharacterized protein n=1 Tax=Brachypodium distachyon TaxID=15368 RepID=A0A0Q3ESE5_BRADI|nr:potassium voltage-gated channel subfamily C member 3 [Brachypodium distachyon]KQJ89196.1 hypothetical protein BRADI_4g24131v3 [Brachypodium distachyon]|eukprot:XP_003576243.1 potassium voltage-gated channel subfamily C member 3 [Brachypodium distachyon]